MKGNLQAGGKMISITEMLSKYGDAEKYRKLDEEGSENNKLWHHLSRFSGLEKAESRCTKKKAFWSFASFASKETREGKSKGRFKSPTRSRINIVEFKIVPVDGGENKILNYVRGVGDELSQNDGRGGKAKQERSIISNHN